MQANFTSAGASVTAPATFIIPFQDANGNAWGDLTGAKIPDAIVSATENALATKISGDTQYKNWYLAHYTDPNGNYDQNATNTALANVVNLAGGVLLGSPSNQYTAQYDYQGVVSFSVPSQIDFGTHIITGALQALPGKMHDDNGNLQGVVVNDDRAKPSNGTLSWSLTVEQTKALTSTSLGLTFGDTMLTFKAPGSTSATPMALNTPITVGEDNNSSTGKLTTVLSSSGTDADGKAYFTLNAPSNLQVPNAAYQGELTWSLVSAP